MNFRLFIFVGAILFDLTLGDTNHYKATSEQHTHNFDVTGKDFRNTQTTKLCLLARLNASITFTYKGNSEHKEMEIPAHASTEGSFCDFDYVSQLQLNFDQVSFTLVFKRDEVEDDHQPQQVYCNKCGNGHWRLRTIKVSAEDMSHILKGAPPTKLKSEAPGSALSTTAGGLITHISLQRGYRCSEERLEANLEVTDAYDIHTDKHSNGNWTVLVRFFSVNVQPFLVTNDIIKDPLLCKDVSVSIVLIITMPIVYFLFFIVCFRLRDKEVFKMWNNKIRRRKTKNDVSGMKPLLKGSFIDTQPGMSSNKLSPVVSVTCTTPEDKKVNII